MSRLLSLFSPPTLFFSFIRFKLITAKGKETGWREKFIVVQKSVV